MSSGILRQRRNLLAICILLPIYLFSGAKVEKINILGSSVSIENSDVVTTSLFILFIYFLIRYFQYFNADKGALAVVNKLAEYQEILIYEFLKKQTQTKINTPIEYNGQLLINFIFTNKLKISKTNNWLTYEGVKNHKIKYNGYFKYSTLKTVVSVNNVTTHLPKNKIRDEKVDKLIKFLEESKDWKKCINTYSGEEIDTLYETTISFKNNVINRKKINGFMNFVFHNHLFTDYYFPFLLSCITAFFIVLWQFKII